MIHFFPLTFLNAARRGVAAGIILLCGQWMAVPRALAQTPGRFVVPEIRADNGTRFSWWSRFELPPGTPEVPAVTTTYKYPHLPNVPGAGDDNGNFSNYNIDVNLQQTGTPTAFLTSSKAIYDFRGSPAFEIHYINAGTAEPVINVIFQGQTAGVNIALEQIRLFYKAEGAEAETEVAPNFKALDNPSTGQFAERVVSAFQWNLTGRGVKDYIIRFASPGSSMALYQAQLDTVAGGEFVQQLGFVLKTGTLPGTRYLTAGSVNRLLPDGAEDRFFAGGIMLELEADADFGFEAVGWVDENGQIIDDPANLKVAFTDRDLEARAIFSPVSWADFRINFFNHENELLETGDDFDDDAVSGPEADPDGDGVNNFGEYAFGGDPYENDAAALRPVAEILTVDGVAYPAISWPRQAAEEETDLVWTVEESTDLQTWKSNADGQSVTVESGSVLRTSGTRRVTARSLTLLNSGSGTRFLRVKVEVAGE